MNIRPQMTLLFVVAIVMTVGEPTRAANSSDPDWFEWVVPAMSPVDLSSLNAAPAGAAGFVGREGDHLVTGDGQRIRFFGVNITGDACFPPENLIPSIAERLASWGVNLVRFVHMDNIETASLIAPEGELDEDGLDVANLRRLDRFVAELKARGIYVNLGIKSGRVHDDTPAGFGESNHSKPLDLFYEPVHQ